MNYFPPIYIAYTTRWQDPTGGTDPRTRLYLFKQVKTRTYNLKENSI